MSTQSIPPTITTSGFTLSTSAPIGGLLYSLQKRIDALKQQQRAQTAWQNIHDQYERDEKKYGMARAIRSKK